MKWTTGLLLAFALTPFFGVLRADTSATAGEAGAEEIEEVQEVAEAPAETPPSPLKLVGRMHPPLVHFPIAWIMLALILEVASRIRLPLLSAFSEKMEGAQMIVLLFATGSALAAILSGTILHGEIEAEPGDHGLLHLHQRLAYITAAFAALALSAKAAAWKTKKKVWVTTSFLLVALAAAFVTITGHLGGSMVFGTGYLLGK